MPKPEGWHEARKSGLGGSDIAAVLGLSKWASPMDVWYQKRGLVDPLEESNAMRRGRLLEPAIAEWYAEETGLQVEDREEMPVVGPKRRVVPMVGEIPLVLAYLSTMQHKQRGTWPVPTSTVGTLLCSSWSTMSSAATHFCATRKRKRSSLRNVVTGGKSTL